jgi:NitT/TauT family transport system permease protein
MGVAPASISAAPRRAVHRTAVHTLQGLVGVVVFGAVWQVLANRHFVLPDYFPTATRTLHTSVTLLAHRDFLLAIRDTLRAMLEGLLLATAIAVPAGVVIGRSEHVYRVTRTVIELLRPISAVALAPLAILVFKTGLAPTIFLVVWTSVWPVLVNTIYGMRDLDPVAYDTARAFGFGRIAILFRVALPNAASYVVTGVRISIGIALAVAIAGEMVAGGGQGIGGWIGKESASGSLVPIYAGAVVVGVIGYLINRSLEIAERRALGWHESLRTEHLG